jgi:hypothetical protein
MEPALTDLVRELDVNGRPMIGRLSLYADVEVELEVVDDLLLDPWFFRTEEEIAAIDDDPTARIIEIKIAPMNLEAFDETRWGF